MDHHPPPTCPEHTAAHYHAQCAACQQYRRRLFRRRSRAVAYGQWQYMVDAGPVREHIATLLQQHMTLPQISAAAGVGLSTTRQIFAATYARTKPAVAARILAVTAQEPRLVDSTGTARRLQALGLAGFGLAHLADLTGYWYPTLLRWQRQHTAKITTVNRDTVRYLYQQLWCADGPDQRAIQIATAHGWCPFEAWTDQTIDDPQALPYTATEQREYVDWERLNRIKQKTIPVGLLAVTFESLSPAEQLELWRAHVAHGGSVRGFRDRYRPVPIDTLRWLIQEVPV